MGKKRKEIKCDTGGLLEWVKRMDKEATVHKMVTKITKKDWDEFMEMLKEQDKRAQEAPWMIYFHTKEAVDEFHEALREYINQ